MPLSPDLGLGGNMDGSWLALVILVDKGTCELGGLLHLQGPCRSGDLVNRGLAKRGHLWLSWFLPPCLGLVAQRIQFRK